MKKILLVFVCSLFAFETVLAQEKNAVGLRYEFPGIYKAML